MGPSNQKRFIYGKLLIIAIVAFILDQVTKIWIVSAMPEGTFEIGESTPPYTVIPGFFYIVHIGNRGAAWGILQGYGFVLALLGILAVSAIFFFRKQLELHRPIMQVIFGLLIGGIVGNIVDRLMHGYVVDFLDFHFGSYRYPSFNVADSCIVIGVGLYMLVGLLDWQKERLNTSKKRPQVKDTTASQSTDQQ